MAGMSVAHPWAFAFGLLGNIISFLTYLAPLPTFYKIYKSKSTQGFQSVPYVVALFSAMLWIYYALLKSDECLLITINTAGCIIETVYIVVFLTYASKRTRISTSRLLLLLNVGVFGIILLLTLLLSSGARRIVVLGWVCVAFSVCVFVAPLSIIRLVVRTRSVEFMPFSLSLSLTVSAVVWFLYGLLIKDKYVALPNVLGFSFGVIQMGLYAMYRNSTPKAAPKEVEAADEDGSVVKVVPEHVVDIGKLGTAAIELKTCEVYYPNDSPPAGEGVEKPATGEAEKAGGDGDESKESTVAEKVVDAVEKV